MNELEALRRRLPAGMIVSVASGAFAGQLAQVVRVVHLGNVLVKVTRSGAVLGFAPSELR